MVLSFCHKGRIIFRFEKSTFSAHFVCMIVKKNMKKKKKKTTGLVKNSLKKGRELGKVKCKSNGTRF